MTTRYRIETIQAARWMSVATADTKLQAEALLNELDPSTYKVRLVHVVGSRETITAITETPAAKSERIKAEWKMRDDALRAGETGVPYVGSRAWKAWAAAR